MYHIAATILNCCCNKLKNKKMAYFPELMLPLLPAIFFLFFLYKWRYNTVAKNLPPSPGKLPIIGNLHQLGTTPHRVLQSLSHSYGPLFMLHLGSVPVVVTSSVEGAREVMKTQDLNFATRPKIAVAAKLVYGPKDVAFTPYGDFWRQMRSICVLHLLSNKRVQSFHRVRAEETSLMIESIKQSGSSAAINLSHMFSSLTSGVISRVVLGRKYESFMNFVRHATEMVGTPNIADYIPWLGWINKINGFEAKVDELCKNFDDFLERVLKDRRDQVKEAKVLGESTEPDFVDILLEFQRENKDTSPIEDDAIKALLIDMFVGGTDTSQSVLEWTAAELLRHPKILAKLQDEVRQVAGRKQDITEDDVENMHYLKAVIKESMRLHSPVPLLAPREALTDTKLLGYNVAQGTQVIINAWAISRDPLVWKNPEEFIPERFFETSIDYTGHHFELVPFGSGRRGCPGIAFAIAVDELALAKLLHKFDLTLPEGMKRDDLDMREAVGMTVHKKVPLFAIAKPASAVA